jgi:hypothetical protein
MKKHMIIMTVIFFGLLVLINSAIFKFMLSGPAVIVTTIISLFMIFLRVKR